MTTANLHKEPRLKFTFVRDSSGKVWMLGSRGWHAVFSRGHLTHLRWSSLTQEHGPISAIPNDEQLTLRQRYRSRF